MARTYEDPAKQKSREKQRDFIAKNLLTFKKPREIRVVCFPGAEVDGEEALEIKEVYDPLGIPRKNITGLEANPERADRLRKADLGITIESQLDLDFFKKTENRFEIISLDYTGYRDEAKWQSLHQIAGRRLLYGNGILCTNYFARRESKKDQAQMLTLQFDTLMRTNKEEDDDYLKELINKFQNEEKLELSRVRDALTDRTLAIMRMGTSAITPISLLEKHPYYEKGRKILEELEQKVIGGEYTQFLVENRVDSGMGKKVLGHPLSFYYRSLHMDLLALHISQVNRMEPKIARFFVDYLTDCEMHAQFLKAIERYNYISNKNATMEMDLIAFVSADRIYRKLTRTVFYNPETGKLTFADLKPQKLIEVWKDSVNQQKFEVPERVSLGSSWQPPKRKENLSKSDAIDLLKSGCSPAEITECYSGFTIMQLAGFKAHYVTLGKTV